MSLSKLVGGDCGGNNTLVQLSGLVRRDATLGHASTSADAFVNEFLRNNIQQPQSFNMKSMLGSLNEIENEPKNQVHATCHTPLQHFMPPAVPRAYGNHTFYEPNTMLHTSHLHPANVRIEYISEGELATLKCNNSDILKAKAKEVIDTIDDEENYSQFMSFMKNLSSGGIDFSLPQEQEQTRKMSQEEMLHEMEEKYKDEWAKLSDVSPSWADEFVHGIPKEYTFADGNVMLENKTALEIGKEKLKMGDIPGAVLCFEAAVKQQPELAEAWCLLGTTQAENEQDPLAIAALRKCLELEPSRTEAYMTLAAAYANENLGKLAILSLYDWLESTLQYTDLLPRDVEPRDLDGKQLESHVESLFIRAAQINPDVDPHVQSALGILFNITQQYDKAVDCFKTALMVSDHDSKLWNRLGATLANSQRSEEAVNAYSEALHLEPGFIRARYNVGITCMNLGAYKEAAEHFLIALNQQDKARCVYPEANSTDNSSTTIWSTLRMVCTFMGEHTLSNLIDQRKLTELNRYFQMQ